MDVLHRLSGQVVIRYARRAGFMRVPESLAAQVELTRLGRPDVTWKSTSAQESFPSNVNCLKAHLRYNQGCNGETFRLAYSRWWLDRQDWH